MPIVKALAKSVLFVAVLYALFRYAGDFSTSQSVVLTIVSWVGYGLYERLNLSRKAECVFTPFCVSFFPHWYELLSDLTLIKDEEDWKRLCESVNEVPASKFSVFKQGFSFTVIRPPSEQDLWPGLTFWNNEKVFLNELELSEPVIENEDDGMRFGFGEKHKFFNHPSWSSLPRVVFKWGMKGYELGLEVQADWWKERSQSGELKKLAKIEEHTDHLCGNTRLVIATLPYSEFAVYYQHVDYDKQGKVQAERDKQLEANGWKRKEEDKDSEIRDPWSRIEHKYFSISHRSI
ncbi:MAG TPA: hypothetical protein VFI38_10695 [Candidatus Acidoferrum sp.]|nr:hypothetical protein [Candidatus Acidoferrum sp.]